MSFRQEVVTTLCDSTRYIKAMATLMIFFGMLSLLSLYVGEPGTGPYALAIINLTVAVLFVATLTGLFWYCQQRIDAY
jgi:hypothetical protein